MKLIAILLLIAIPIITIAQTLRNPTDMELLTIFSKHLVNAKIKHNKLRQILCTPQTHTKHIIIINCISISSLVVMATWIITYTNIEAQQYIPINSSWNVNKWNIKSTKKIIE
jgi:hypothetical protein